MKLLLIVISLLLSSLSYAQQCDDFTNHEMRKLRSNKTINLCDFADKPLLLVNTASNCDFTPQFKGLEQIHNKYKNQGLIVIGFPSDDFYQEEDDEKATAKMCFINYGVTFTMLAPVSIIGKNAHPIFKHLADETSTPKWNFYKYLISKDRQTITKFNSKVTPDSYELNEAIEQSL